MASDVNKHGLTRYIPSEVKRAVRKRCGFGCIKCGSAVYQYEHFDPEFEDAMEHTAEGITLLCGGCHNKKTTGWASSQGVAQANRKPKCLRLGFASEVFEVSVQPPTIYLGGVSARDVDTILEIEGERVLWVEPPEETGASYRINANFLREDGQPLLSIEDNEWKTPTDNWDVTTIAGRITIRSKKNRIELALRTIPPSELRIERLKAFHRGWIIDAEMDKDVIFSRKDVVHRTSGIRAYRVETMISIGESFLEVPRGMKPGGWAHIQEMVIGSDDSAQPSKRKASVDFDAPLPSPNPFALPLRPYQPGGSIFLYLNPISQCPCGSGRSFGLCHRGNEVHQMAH